jgi:ELWxxDGT repeat protein
MTETGTTPVRRGLVCEPDKHGWNPGARARAEGTDGTAAGTVLVRDISPAAMSHGPPQWGSGPTWLVSITWKQGMGGPDWNP